MPSTYFIPHPGGDSATVITRRGSARIIRRKNDRWWCDCPPYRALEQQGHRLARAQLRTCQHTNLAETAQVRLQVSPRQPAFPQH